ncbi:MAG: cob(I)yrinic acid a,c-diamide adenosyltransferase [Dehalococcoidia bacterium]
MVRINRVYTRGGDGGETSLIGGQRVAKDSLRIEAYGTVDELNSTLGSALALGLDGVLEAALETVQQTLFDIGSDLAIREEDKAERPVPAAAPADIRQLESWIDTWNESLPPLDSFVLPGGTPAVAQLHVARTVCRRAERAVIALSREEAIGDTVIPYLNRLSDLLFVAARFQAHASGTDEVLWKPGAR